MPSLSSGPSKKVSISLPLSLSLSVPLPRSLSLYLSLYIVISVSLCVSDAASAPRCSFCTATSALTLNGITWHGVPVRVSHPQECTCHEHTHACTEGVGRKREKRERRERTPPNALRQTLHSRPTDILTCMHARTHKTYKPCTRTPVSDVDILEQPGLTRTPNATPFT